MHSLLGRILNIFFEKPPRRNKYLFPLQTILVFWGIFVWFQGRNNINNSAYYTYHGIFQIIIGFMMLLMGVENFLVNKKNKKKYIIWFVIALMWFGMALDQITFLR